MTHQVTGRTVFVKGKIPVATTPAPGNSEEGSSKRCSKRCHPTAKGATQETEPDGWVAPFFILGWWQRTVPLIKSAGSKYERVIHLSCVMSGWHLSGVGLRCHPPNRPHSMDCTFCAFCALPIENFGAITIWEPSIYRPLLDGWHFVTFEGCHSWVAPYSLLVAPCSLKDYGQGQFG